MSKSPWNKNQAVRRFQEKQVIRQRGAVKHKIQDIPFEILPLPLHSPGRSRVDIDRNDHRPSPQIIHSARKDTHSAVYVDPSIAFSPSISALRTLKNSRQKKIHKHGNKIQERSSFVSNELDRKVLTPSLLQRTNPVLKTPPRISVGPTPLKEQLLDDNVLVASAIRPIQNVYPGSDIKHLKKKYIKNMQDEKVVKRQKIYESLEKNHRNYSDKEGNSDKEGYSDTEIDECDDSYDETETKVPITVHKFSERSSGSVNEIDVVSQVISELLKRLRKKTESTYAKKVIHAFEEEVAVKFLEMTDTLDHYLVLDSAVKKSARNIAHLRNELFIIRKARSDTAVKIHSLRQRHNDANNEIQALKNIQNFFDEIEILHDKVSSNVPHSEKTGIISLLHTVTPSMTKSWGILERLSIFNTFLEKVDKALT